MSMKAKDRITINECLKWSLYKIENIDYTATYGLPYDMAYKHKQEKLHEINEAIAAFNKSYKKYVK